MNRTMMHSLKFTALLCGFALVSTPLLPAQEAAATPAGAEEAVILTPKPPPTPRINGAKVFGVRPGHPFLFTVPATGDRPMTFSAEGLPAGLTLNTDNGHITGSIAKEGTLHGDARRQKRRRFRQPPLQDCLRPGHRSHPGPGLE